MSQISVSWRSGLIMVRLERAVGRIWDKPLTSRFLCSTSVHLPDKFSFLRESPVF